ncbi:MAG: carbohydrate kinase family protein [Oscillospiraceae bacterium]|nr:carbohydrate kinase family protein [Oscillospiraceae bacterium]
MDYVVVGFLINNALHFYNGDRIENVPGGCGLYSFSGIRLFDDSCLLVAGAGRDFGDCFGPWFDRNGIDRRGILLKSDRTMSSILTYDAEGGYVDRSAYGPSLVHAPALELGADDYAPFLPGAKGLYLYGRRYPDREKLLALRRRYGFRVMLEISPYAQAEDLPALLGFLGCCDCFSLNRRESFRLFSVHSEEEAVRAIRETGKTCYYRLGEKGACMVTADAVDFVPALHVREPEKDPTGCGNCSAAAAFWALCEGYGPRMAACVANTAAGYNALQYGPVPRPDDRLRREALAFARAACARCFGPLESVESH